MELGLNDKVVLITGGARGIGAAAVQVFSKEKCNVVFVDQDSESGSELAKSSGPNGSFIEAELNTAGIMQTGCGKDGILFWWN